MHRVCVSKDKVYVTNVDKYINTNNSQTIKIYMINSNICSRINMLKRIFRNITVNLWKLIKLELIWKFK
jgi:hypothetical protein